VNTLNLSIAALLKAYRSGELTPRQVVEYVLKKCEEFNQHNIWITLFSDTQLAVYLDNLPDGPDESLPLYGIPFSIKDNIDVGGIDTTCACKAYAYRADESANVVNFLVRAGAIPIGKTNMDQFAAGLVGTRSEYGASANAFDPRYLAGGSSSGAALSVALGLCSFALGTDTAGSGRVPAAFNNIVGMKPSRGLVSCHGVVPACRSLDCVSIFSLNVDDADYVFDVAATYDSADAYARRNPFSNSRRHYGRVPEQFRFGVVAEKHFPAFQNNEYSELYKEYCRRLVSLGGSAVELDFTPFVNSAALLYQGPWLAERYAAIEPFIRDHEKDMFAVTRSIITQANSLRTVDAFPAFYQLQAYKQAADAILADVDFIVTPTTVDHYQIAQVNSDPIRLNSQLGYYTNFMNLLDLCAVAIPAAIRKGGLPFGVTLFGQAFNDRKLLSYARHFQCQQEWPAGKTNVVPVSAPREESIFRDYVDVVVCGAHLSGFPLNWQLVERGATLQRRDKTAAEYRLYAIPGKVKRPGLVRHEQSGAAILVELWRVPMENFASFVAGIPEPLGIGKVQLSDGRFYTGFICENYAIESAEDITSFGGWAAYIKR